MVTIENCEKLFHKQKNKNQIEKHIAEALEAAGIINQFGEEELILRAERVGNSKIRSIDEIRRVSPRGGIDKFTVEIPRVCHKIPAIVCSVVGDPQELEKIFFGKKSRLADSMEKARNQVNASTQKEEKFIFQNNQSEAEMAKSTFKIAELTEEKALFYVALLDYQGVGTVTTVQLKKILTDLSVMNGSNDADDLGKFRAAIRCWVNPVGSKHSTSPTEGNVYAFEWDKVETEIDALTKDTEGTQAEPEKTLEQVEEDFVNEMHLDFDSETEKSGENISHDFFEEEPVNLPKNSLEISNELTLETTENLPEKTSVTEEKNSSDTSWFDEIQKLVEREKYFVENGEASRIKNSISAISREISELEVRLNALQTQRYELQTEYNALPEPLSYAEQAQLEKLRQILTLQ